MRKFYTLSLLVCLSFTAFAQQYVYVYDNAGNRTQVIVYRSSLYTADTIVKPIVEKAEEAEFRLYPNPTKGLLTLEVSGLENGLPKQCAIFDESGKSVARQKLDNSNSFSFNLGNRPNGLYILRLQYGDKQKVWKILKD